MKRQHATVKTITEGSNVELHIDGLFASSWNISITTPAGMMPNRTATSVAQVAYEEGYAAAREDLKDWVGGK